MTSRSIRSFAISARVGLRPLFIGFLSASFSALGCGEGSPSADEAEAEAEGNLGTATSELRGGAVITTHREIGFVRANAVNNANCTGTLITRDAMITAAHCVGYGYRTPLGDNATYGWVDFFNPTLTPVGTTIWQASYRQNILGYWSIGTTFGENDIAVVLLDTRVGQANNSPPPAMSSYPLLATKTTTEIPGTQNIEVVGLGRSGASCQVPVNNTRRRMLIDSNRVESGRPAYTCGGDSGGPLFYTDGPQAGRIVGLVSGIVGTSETAPDARTVISNIPKHQYAVWRELGKLRSPARRPSEVTPPPNATPAPPMTPATHPSIFDPQFYLDYWADLRAVFGGQNLAAATQHWLSSGRYPENRYGSPAFLCAYYLTWNPDIYQFYGTNCAAAQDHFVRSGNAEGRLASPAFVPWFYLANHPDIAASFPTFQAATWHYVLAGVNEARAPSPAFEPGFYLAANPDLVSVLGAGNMRGATIHWLQSGITEGRRASPRFDPAYYLYYNPDVAAYYGSSNYQGAVMHWLMTGYAEGRRALP